MEQDFWFSMNRVSVNVDLIKVHVIQSKKWNHDEYRCK